LIQKKIFFPAQFVFISLIILQVLCLSSVNAQSHVVDLCLTQVEQQSNKIKSCRLQQILPDECDRYLQPSILITLQCAQKGATKEQINSAIIEGEKAFSSNNSPSPYEQIKKKISGSPYFIQPEKENFIAYSSQCDAHKEKLFRFVAQSISDGQAKFIVSPLKPKTCLTLTNLHKKYPVISDKQLDLFTSGYYLERHPSAERPYEHIEVMKADSLAEAGDFFSRMKQRVKLTINTEPENAEVKIIGMKRAYKKGMKLNVGQYQVWVTSPTYTPQELTLNVEKDKSTFAVKLESSIENIVCQENQQGFPLEFINRNYLKKLNNCTYQFIHNSNTNTPFKLLIAKNSHRSKYLMKAKLAIFDSAQPGVSALSITEITPRQTRIAAGSSGISDVPEALHKEALNDSNKSAIRLTILDATYSY